MIEIEHLKKDLSQAIPILRVLRAGLDHGVFQDRLERAVQGGYQMILAQLDGQAAGCLGYRIFHDVCWGKSLYVDDLVVLAQHRGNEIGAALISAARDTARSGGCDHIRLCSGLDRQAAHRFYERHDLNRTSLQFACPLEQGDP